MVMAGVLHQGTLVIRTVQKESSPEPHSPKCSICGPQRQNRAKDLCACNLLGGGRWGGEQFQDHSQDPREARPSASSGRLPRGATGAQAPARTLWSGCEEKPQRDCARGEKQTGLRWTKQVLRAEKAFQQRNAGAGRREVGARSGVSRPWVSGMSGS